METLAWAEARVSFGEDVFDADKLVKTRSDRVVSFAPTVDTASDASLSPRTPHGTLLSAWSSVSDSSFALLLPSLSEVESEDARGTKLDRTYKVDGATKTDDEKDDDDDDWVPRHAEVWRRSASELADCVAAALASSHSGTVVPASSTENQLVVKRILKPDRTIPRTKLRFLRRRTTRVAFSTATIYEFPRTLGGCTVPTQADGPSLGMAYHHTHVRVEYVSTRGPRDTLGPLPLSDRYGLLWAAGCAADAMDDAWAETEALHAHRMAALRELVADEDTALEKAWRRWTVRQCMLAHTTSHKWHNQVRVTLRRLFRSAPWAQH
ncbi:hypothetical protein SDRG_05888 [Saprolegnia diclina VS20]|uniref:Uncharacterized protein n=1 Tax=Saprolegnia diclina (strain VS20) TaxID=1156394 RepID=T0QNY4_SAPDV|nr:hypothetical protein SDRG_05888 [Saprolegnia diclina VS20]EQC36431.1 hypothetical protein SDRG_05888 [Saprolegnia diclina VS20]|eukprot:XP_008609852.1 hypothetical protein SDRG_05888 [Saprolegnia diclina VS20]